MHMAKLRAQSRPFPCKKTRSYNIITLSFFSLFSLLRLSPFLPFPPFSFPILFFSFLFFSPPFLLLSPSLFLSFSPPVSSPLLVLLFSLFLIPTSLFYRGGGAGGGGGTCPLNLPLYRHNEQDIYNCVPAISGVMSIFQATFERQNYFEKNSFWHILFHWNGRSQTTSTNHYTNPWWNSSKVNVNSGCQNYILKGFRLGVFMYEMKSKLWRIVNCILPLKLKLTLANVPKTRRCTIQEQITLSLVYTNHSSSRSRHQYK